MTATSLSRSWASQVTSSSTDLGGRRMCVKTGERDGARIRANAVVRGPCESSARYISILMPHCTRSKLFLATFPDSCGSTGMTCLPEGKNVRNGRRRWGGARKRESTRLPSKIKRENLIDSATNRRQAYMEFRLTTSGVYICE